MGPSPVFRLILDPTTDNRQLRHVGVWPPVVPAVTDPSHMTVVTAEGTYETQRPRRPMEPAVTAPTSSPEVDVGMALTTVAAMLSAPSA
jgi:hypothetical protein